MQFTPSKSIHLHRPYKKGFVNQFNGIIQMKTHIPNNRSMYLIHKNEIYGLFVAQHTIRLFIAYNKANIVWTCGQTIYHCKFSVMFVSFVHLLFLTVLFYGTCLFMKRHNYNCNWNYFFFSMPKGIKIVWGVFFLQFSW